MLGTEYKDSISSTKWIVLWKLLNKADVYNAEHIFLSKQITMVNFLRLAYRGPFKPNEPKIHDNLQGMEQRDVLWD